MLDEGLPLCDEAQVSVELWGHSIVLLVFTTMVEECHVNAGSERFTVDFLVGIRKCFLILLLVTLEHPLYLLKLLLIIIIFSLVCHSDVCHIIPRFGQQVEHYVVRLLKDSYDLDLLRAQRGRGVTDLGHLDEGGAVVADGQVVSYFIVRVEIVYINGSAFGMSFNHLILILYFFYF